MSSEDVLGDKPLCKTMVVTGASSGIGLATAEGLAATGARVVLVCRDGDRGEAARSHVSTATGTAGHDLALADLSRPAEVARVTADILERHPRIDVLVNNAGFMGYPERRVTVDGFEATFALNHLGYWGMTHGLLPGLRAASEATGEARVVCVSSVVSNLRRAAYPLDDLQFERGYAQFWSYSRTKRMNVDFTRELAARLGGTGITANCLHPGNISTGVARTWTRFGRVIYALGRPFLGSPARGARGSIRLATDSGLRGVTGRYFHMWKERRGPAADPERQRGLWAATAALTGVDALA